MAQTISGMSRGMRITHMPLLVWGLWGCNSGKSVIDGLGPQDDARLISDVYTWGCDAQGDGYDGVYSQTVTLEYAPDALTELSLPSAGGCSVDLDMFPASAGSGGGELPDISGEPTWATDSDNGTLTLIESGFWKDEIGGDYHGCQSVVEVLSGGTVLGNAGVLEGVKGPEASSMPDVNFYGEDDDEIDEVAWGDEITVEWDENDWDNVWIQLRREREDIAWESITCNVTGDDSFSITETIWDLLDESLIVDQNNIYVGFETTREAKTDDGLRVETLTRALAVMSVDE